MKYLYAEDIMERGYKEIPFSEMDEFKQKKHKFVEEHLKPTIIAADVGWNDVEYKLMHSESGCKTEFVVLWSGEKNNSGSRWIDVSCNSCGAIIRETCNNMW
jgi:hypothetical protein